MHLIDNFMNLYDQQLNDTCYFANVPNLYYVSLDFSLSMTLDTGEAVFALSISEGVTEVIEGNDSLPSLCARYCRVVF